MKSWLPLAILFSAFPLLLAAEEEILRYSINWPSGLSLGEATLESRPAGGRLEFKLLLDASVPGFPVTDQYRALATSALCSVEFEKKYVHGKRQADEKSTFDAARNVAVRETGGGGGRSEIEAPPCARDALTFLYFLRAELSKGRLPPPQTVFFGAPYQVRLQYKGAQRVPIGGTPEEADHLQVSLKGPASETAFEIYFGKDAARTPLLVRLPLSMGTFSMELQR